MCQDCKRCRQQEQLNLVFILLFKFKQKTNHLQNQMVGFLHFTMPAGRKKYPDFIWKPLNILENTMFMTGR